MEDVHADTESRLLFTEQRHLEREALRRAAASGGRALQSDPPPPAKAALRRAAAAALCKVYREVAPLDEYSSPDAFGEVFD